MKALILTNGEYGDYSFCKDTNQYDMIICADNGMYHARKLHIIPDYIIGDFDSSKKEDLAYYKAKGCRIVTLPSKKDETDTELALDYAIEQGASQVEVYGGLGTRIDHNLGNIHLVYKGLQQGIGVKLINAHNELLLIKDQITLEGDKGQLISLIPFAGGVKGVTTEGLAYAVHDMTFPVGKPFGVSNYMLSTHASVSIKEGLLLVIKSND